MPTWPVARTPCTIVTIDGPTGSGKGTISRGIAQRVGWHLLDSGALYSLVALAGQKSLADDAVMTDYAEGLAHWRAGTFDVAAECFARAAGADRPSANFLARARELADRPPPSDWDPVRALQEK